jgi:hypothetical protein
MANSATASTLPSEYTQFLQTYTSALQLATTAASEYIEPDKLTEIEEIRRLAESLTLAEIETTYNNIIQFYTLQPFKLFSMEGIVYYENEGRQTNPIRISSLEAFIRRGEGTSTASKEENSVPLNAKLKSINFLNEGTREQFWEYYLKVDKLYENITKHLEFTKRKVRIPNTAFEGTPIDSLTEIITPQQTSQTGGNRQITPVDECINRAFQKTLHQRHGIVGWSYDSTTQKCSYYSTTGDEVPNKPGITSGYTQAIIDSRNHIIDEKLSASSSDIAIISAWKTKDTAISAPFKRTLRSNDSTDWVGNGRMIDSQIDNDIKKCLTILYYMYSQHSARYLASTYLLAETNGDISEQEPTPGRMIRLIMCLKTLKSLNEKIQSYIAEYRMEQYAGQQQETTHEGFTATGTFVPIRDSISQNTTKLRTQRFDLQKTKVSVSDISEKNKITLNQLTDAQSMAQAQLVGLLLSIGFLSLVSFIPGNT